MGLATSLTYDNSQWTRFYKLPVIQRALLGMIVPKPRVIFMIL